MKGKRQKKVKKNLNFYQQFFGFTSPYTVVADAQFCKAALEAKVNILEQLPKYFDAPVRVVTLKCILAECQKNRSSMYGPLKVLEQFDTVPCVHKKNRTVPPHVCMTWFAKQDKMKCVFASQDEKLNANLRELPGVPFLLFVHGVMTLQAPATASYHASKDILTKACAPSEYERSVIMEMKKKLFGESEEVAQKKKKRKGPKQPNPLSCMKKKKTSKNANVGVVISDSAAENETGKKKRKRVRKWKRKAVVDGSQANISEGNPSQT